MTNYDKLVVEGFKLPSTAPITDNERGDDGDRSRMARA